MIIKTQTAPFNSLKVSTGLLVAGLSSDPFKEIIEFGRIVTEVTSSALLIGNLAYGTWSQVKEIFKQIEPYQPLVAACSIIGRAVLKTRTTRQIQRDIDHLESKTKMLEKLNRCNGINCTRRLQALRNEIQRKNDDRVQMMVSVAQLGSLIFDHPGSNAWNYTNAIYSRLYSLRNKNIVQSPKCAALGAVSILGTTASFLRITGITTGNHPLSHLAIGASFIGMAIESIPTIKECAAMIKKWVNNKLSPVL